MTGASLSAGPGWTFHHLGLACRAFDSERTALAAIGYQPVGPEVEDAGLGVKVCFLEGGGPRIELVAPLLRDGAAVSSILEGWLARGTKIYHIAYTVTDFAALVESRLDRKAKLVAGPLPAVAFEGRQVAFFMLRDGLLIELIEE